MTELAHFNCSQQESATVRTCMRNIASEQEAETKRWKAFFCYLPSCKWCHLLRRSSQLRCREPWGPRCCRSALGAYSCRTSSDRRRSSRRWLGVSSPSSCCFPSPSTSAFSSPTSFFDLEFSREPSRLDRNRKESEPGTTATTGQDRPANRNLAVFFCHRGREREIYIKRLNKEETRGYGSRWAKYRCLAIIAHSLTQELRDSHYLLFPLFFSFFLFLVSGITGLNTCLGFL